MCPLFGYEFCAHLQNNVVRGRVTFADVETATVDSADVVEGDYSNATELLLSQASTKAQARLKRK